MTAVGFLGLGNMGGPMAANLVKAGHTLTVWNRSSAKADAFAQEHGATAVSSPREVAAASDVVISMLADDAALTGAYDDPDGLLAGLRSGTHAIDMSTVSPLTVADLRTRTAEVGVAFVDAPVSGATAAATAGTLTIMVGADSHEYDAVLPVLQALGDPVIHLGPSGTGSTMKLAVNAIVHGLNGVVSEALVLAERAGIERTRAYEVFVNSAIAAPFVHYRRATFERPDEIPVAFKLALAGKDLRLALELAGRVGAELPQTTSNLAVLDRAVEAGLGDRDESAVAVLMRQGGTGPTTDGTSS